MSLELVNWGISYKKDGSMKNEPDNRWLFFAKNNLDKKIIISAELVHDKKVVVVNRFKHSQTVMGCDALITNNPAQVLTITVADCLPVYFYDSQKQVVALAHAGWRGLINGILLNVINSFKNDYQSASQDIFVFIGPHIKACHFEVKADVATLFPDNIKIKRNQKVYLDLELLAKQQLLDLGILLANIKVSADCTYCLPNKYFSYRKDKEQGLRTMLAYINLNNKN